MPDAPPFRFEYNSSTALLSTANLLDDSIVGRYVVGFADLMRGAPFSLEGSSEALEILGEIDLGPVLDALHSAYIASAIRSKPVRFTYSCPLETLGFSWDFDYTRTFLSSNGKDGWAALENLSLWRIHYNRYREVVESLPELLKRLEIIDITDEDLGKATARLSETELRQKIRDDANVLSDTLRNDGFFVHGPNKKIEIKHRSADQIVHGLRALKDDVLAACDYTESHLWNVQAGGGGLAGVDKKDRETMQLGVQIRLARCWKPVIEAFLTSILDWYGADSSGVGITWASPFVEDAESVARTELMSAQAAQIWETIGVFSKEEIRARYKGGTTPSPYATPAPETAPIGLDTPLTTPEIGGRAVASDAQGITKNSAFKTSVGMRNEAARGIAIHSLKQRVGTVAGVRLATAIADNEPIPLLEVKQMYRFFVRHESARSSEGWGSNANPTNARISWMLWGGDAGYSWCKGVRDRAISAGVW